MSEALLSTVKIRSLGQEAYDATWLKMRDFTNQRHANTMDEIWFLEHPPVFTQGQNGKKEHLLAETDIPVIQTDRGGQITYHGPGQLICYVLMDLKRKKFTVRQLVNLIEQSVIELLKQFHIEGKTQSNAPGVYIGERKIGSLGLRIRRFASYHGLALNVNMDLTPFNHINPCGFKTLKMTQFAEFYPEITLKTAEIELGRYLSNNLGYTHLLFETGNQDARDNEATR